MPLFNVMSIFTSQLVFLLRWSQGQTRNLYLDRFTYSRHFRNFHTHISSSSSRLVYRVHHPSSGNDRCLLDSYGEPKQRREGNTLSALADTMGSWSEGIESVEKHSPERSDMTFQRSKRFLLRFRISEDIYFVSWGGYISGFCYKLSHYPITVHSPISLLQVWHTASQYGVY